MADGTIRWDQTVDPFGRNGGIARYEENSRDPCRTPFHWNDYQNAGKYALILTYLLTSNGTFHFYRMKIEWISSQGFSTAQRTWLPVNSNHWYLNLAFQKACLRSHYQTYKSLLRLRSSPTIALGNLTMHTLSDWILILTRYTGLNILLFSLFLHGLGTYCLGFKCFRQNVSR